MTKQDETDFELPTSTYELIDLLDEAFPAQCIGPNQTLAEANRYAGRRELIEELIEMKKEEQEGSE